MSSFEAGCAVPVLMPIFFIVGLPGAIVRDGVLDPEGATFRALVLPDVTGLPAATLRRIVDLALSGLPIIVVGELPRHAPSLQPGLVSDARIRQLASDLIALPKVVRTDAASKSKAGSRAPGATATRTRRRVLPEIALDTLTPWSSIIGLEDVSGIGIYRAQVIPGLQWTPDAGAVLMLGRHSDTVRVRINGRAPGPVDQLADCIDLGHALQAGDNRIEIELATTLNNVLLMVDRRPPGPWPRPVLPKPPSPRMLSSNETTGFHGTCMIRSVCGWR